MKFFISCRTDKSAGSFNKDKQKTDGLCAYCRECASKKAKKRRLSNPERTQRMYARQREYYNSDPDRKKHIKSLQRKWYQENRSKQLAKGRANWLKREYDLSLEDYEAMVQSQNGKCAICDSPPGNRRLSVDHDHKTGAIRGLLCDVCNVGLGAFQDDSQRLAGAIKYLRKNNDFQL